ncbi:hypothetical protein [Mycobacterium sp.]|uniref:hypothetical protein n=1 Tax=Mycobacterium sp. TaxID=1785 RepID=UPI003D6AF124
MNDQLPIIHVDYNPDHEFETFGDTGGQPILSYRTPTPRQLRNLERLRAGRDYRGDLPDGWVLTYEASWCDERREEGEPPGELGDNPDEYVTGIVDLTAVDEAVRAAQVHLVSLGYREPRQ